MLFLQFLAIAAVAIYFAPTGAHLFELPNKLALSVDDYMVAQRLYDGWAAFGAVILVALALVLAHAVAVRRSRAALALSAAAFLALAATQAIFWGWTYPVNAETDNWSRAPALFEAARRQWEYSHAASAVLAFLSLMLLCASALVSRSRPPAG
jgi:polyferredoxin